MGHWEWGGGEWKETLQNLYSSLDLSQKTLDFLLQNFGHKIDSSEWRLGGSVGSAPDLGSGRDLAVCEFEPLVGLVAVSAEAVSADSSLDPLPHLPPPTPTPCAPLLFTLSPSQK